jgi:N-acetylmuramoyl-L-alanine amidase
LPLPKTAAVAVLRVLLDSGHGLSNKAPNIDDPGAIGCIDGVEITEAALVREIADQVIDRFYFGRDENVSPTTRITVTPTVECNSACVRRHPRSSHLAAKIEYLNDHYAPFDFVLSLHMNSSDNPNATGTEVVYGGNAPASRLRQADELSRVVSGVLGLPNRGPLIDTATPRKKIALLRRTKAPALLIELGFITNENDVRAVRECGAEAVIAAINAIAGKK